MRLGRLEPLQTPEVNLVACRVASLGSQARPEWRTLDLELLRGPSNDRRLQYPYRDVVLARDRHHEHKLVSTKNQHGKTFWDFKWTANEGPRKHISIPHCCKTCGKPIKNTDCLDVNNITLDLILSGRSKEKKTLSVRDFAKLRAATWH